MNRFERAMRHLAAHEGGYVNDPRDPGGATNKGVTQRVYDAYRGREKRSVRKITDEEVYAIYRAQYWDAVNADNLPQGVGYCVFDASVNSGPAQAAKWLQRAAGVADDGIIGQMTIDAVWKASPIQLIDSMCDQRLAFMKRLSHWSAFKNGWTRRVSEVRAQAKEWVTTGDVKTASTAKAQPKATGQERRAVTLLDTVSNPSTITAAGGAISAVAGVANGSGPVQWAIGAALVIGVIAFAYIMVRRSA